MDLDVLFVGTAGSAPTARRGLPATLVRRGGDRLLFDCGEGTQRQLLRSVGLLDLEEIFISHFHADHFLGLPGLLKTFSLRGREQPLTIYGPPRLQALFDALRPVMGKTGFEVRVVELEPNEKLERDGYAVAAFAVAHRVTAYGYALIEDERPGRFDEARARELGVTPGPDFGRLQQGEPVGGVTPDQVLGPARPGRKVVLAGDTAPCEMTEVVVPRRRPARPRGDLLGGGRRAGARDGPLDRARRRRAGSARRRPAAGADAHLAALRGARAARRGARGVREHDRAEGLRPGRDPVRGAGRADPSQGREQLLLTKL